MKKVYITGISGTGKTTIANLLKEKGIKSYSIDEVRGLCCWKNKVDGTKVAYEAKLDRAFIDSHVWMCNIGQLKDLVNQEGMVVVLGLAENQNEFLPLFDKVIVLQCRPETFLKRILARKDNVFGQDETAQKYLLNTYEKFESEMLKNGAVAINVEDSLDMVVRKIINEVQ
jgi:dephospho-CoA kinase